MTFATIVCNVDYISLTDLAKFKDKERFDYIIKTGLEASIHWNMLERGNYYIIKILDPPNSMYLKMNLLVVD